MKSKKQLREDALARRQRNVTDYKAGRLGSLVVPDGADQAEFLKAKLATAEKDVQTLKTKLGVKDEA